MPPTRSEIGRVLSALSTRPVPTGALHRFWTLGGLQARIGLAYLAYWAKSWFQSKDARQQALFDTHLAATVRLLETMGYLRGAVMKISQAAANFPEIVPDQFAETLSKLHFEAPPCTTRELTLELTTPLVVNCQPSAISFPEADISGF